MAAPRCCCRAPGRAAGHHGKYSPAPAAPPAAYARVDYNPRHALRREGAALPGYGSRGGLRVVTFPALRSHGDRASPAAGARPAAGVRRGGFRGQVPAQDPREPLGAPRLPLHARRPDLRTDQLQERQHPPVAADDAGAHPGPGLHLRGAPGRHGGDSYEIQAVKPDERGAGGTYPPACAPAGRVDSGCRWSFLRDGWDVLVEPVSERLCAPGCWKCG